MTLGDLWRYVGPASVLVFPFGFVAADRGIPRGTWWDESRDPAVVLLFMLTIMALVQGVRGLIHAPRDRRATIERDIQQLARRAFVPVNAHLPRVPIDALGVHVWIADGERLNRLVKYTMEQQRARTPISWCCGKGVIGIAWERRQPLVADLTELYARADELTAAEFEQLDSEFRYGLSAEEVNRGGKYKSVLACPLTAEDNNDVIGVLSVDCAVAGHAEQLAELLDDRQFQDVLGSCESALRRY
jgi:hypothetical protein